MIKLRLLRWESILDYPVGPKKERLDHQGPWALKMPHCYFDDGDRGRSQEMMAAFGNWKKQGKGLSPGTRPWTQPCWHLAFRPLRLILDFVPPEFKNNEFVLFKVTKCRVICYSSNRNLIHQYEEDKNNWVTKSKSHGEQLQQNWVTR